MAVIGNLAVQLSANTSGLQRGLKKAQSEVSAFDRGMKKLGSAIAVGATAAFAAATVAAVRFGMEVKRQFAEVDSLAKTSDKLGVTTEAMAGLQLAANLAGIENEALAKIMQTMANNVSDAAGGLGEAKDSIKELGLDAGRLNLMSPDRQLSAFADAFAQIANQGDKIRLATDIFGARGMQILQLIQNGSASLRQATIEADKFGLAISRPDAAKVEDANDAITRMKAAISGLARVFAVELAPAIESAAKALTEFLSAGSKRPSILNYWQNVTKDILFNVTTLEARIFESLANSFDPNNNQIGTADSALLYTLFSLRANMARIEAEKYRLMTKLPQPANGETGPFVPGQDYLDAVNKGTGKAQPVPGFIGLMNLITSGIGVYNTIQRIRDIRSRFKRDPMFDAGPMYAEFQQTQLGRVGSGVAAPKKQEVKVDQMPTVLERLGQMLGVLRQLPYAPARAG